MRSRMGFLGVAALLLALPVTIASSMFVSADDETAIHLLLALSFGLLALAVFDFETPSWAKWVGFTGAAGFATIVLIQGVSEAMPGDSLHHFAFDVIGGELEFASVFLFLGWLATMVLSDSRDKSRLAGITIMSVVLVVSVYTIAVRLMGDEPAKVLKIVYLAPLVWFMVESMSRKTPETRVNRVLVTAS